jgi:hypothetical protein
MSQKQRFHHDNNKPTPPAGGWAPAYTNLKNRFFKHLVNAPNNGQILPTDGAAEVYNTNPYLWPISPYTFISILSASNQFHVNIIRRRIHSPFVSAFSGLSDPQSVYTELTGYHPGQQL